MSLGGLYLINGVSLHTQIFRCWTIFHSIDRTLLQLYRRLVLAILHLSMFQPVEKIK